MLPAVRYETGAATTDALLDLDGSRLAVKTGGNLSWVIFDLHGSVVALCPAGSTTLSDAYRYDAWGQQMTSGTTTNPWRYRGLLDVSPMTANPILAMGARFYQPSLATFTQEDSVQGRAADPLSMNRYLYAEANPATLVDPDGHAVTNTSTYCSPYNDFCTATGSATQTYNATSTSYNPAPTADTSYCSRFPAECSGTKTTTLGPPATHLDDYDTPSGYPHDGPDGSSITDCTGCQVDSYGYVYDPYGNDANGNPFPFVCVGARDVRACLRYVAYLGTSPELADPTHPGTAGACVGSSAAAGVGVSSTICGVVDSSGHRAILVTTGGSFTIGASTDLMGGSFSSNGLSVYDQAGTFKTTTIAIGFPEFVGAGISTGTGWNDQGQQINSTTLMGGLGAGTPALSFGSSSTVVITDEQVMAIYLKMFPGDPFATGQRLLHAP